MLNHKQLSELIIKPALEDLQLYSQDAVQLLLFTCAVESDGGTYLKQLQGPALGIYQMEPNTYNDIWQNYILGKSEIKLRLLHNFEAPTMPSEERLIYDLRYASAMTMIHYNRSKDPLPNANDIFQLWGYYKLHYNTKRGNASVTEAINKYGEFMKS
jgi:hypothetical protein